MRHVADMLRLLAAGAILAATPSLALADFANIPEPETLALIAVGAVALIVARRRK